MNNTYYIKNKSIKDLLDSVDEFTTNIERFKLKYKDYNYTINLIKNNKLWDAEITIKYEKQEDIKALSGAIEPPTLL